MTNKFFFFISFIITFISIFVATLVWNKMNIPFPENVNINGDFFNTKYHHRNNFVKFFLFMFIPVFFNLIFFLKLKVFNIQNFFLCIYEKSRKIKNTSLNIFFLILIIFLIIIDFFFIDLSYHKIDMFHEGQSLTGAFNFINTSKIFETTNIYIGAFFEVFSGYFTNQIFGNLNITSHRLFSIILNKLTLIFMIVLAWKISNSQNLIINKKIIFFFILSLTTICLFNINSFSIRDLASIFFLLFLFNYIFKKKKFYLYSLCILCPISFFYSVERATFINVVLFFFLIYLFFQNKYKDIIFSIFFLLTTWIIIYFFLGSREFDFFIENIIFIYKYSAWIQGIPYPQPFSDFSILNLFATGALIFITIQALIILNIFFSTNKLENNLKIFYLFLFLVSLTHFSTGLTRSDGGHIKTALSFPVFSLTIFFTSFCLNLKSNIFHNFLLLKKKNYIKSVIFIFLFFIIANTNFKNIKNFKRFKDYTLAENNKLLNDRYIFLIRQLKPIYKDENCIQVFTHDAALPYLLKKVTCNKFHMVYMIGTLENQKKYIKDLENKANRYIITDGEQFYNIHYPPNEYYKLIYSYIKENYRHKKKILSWNLYERK